MDRFNHAQLGGASTLGCKDSDVEEPGKHKTALSSFHARLAQITQDIAEQTQRVAMIGERNYGSPPGESIALGGVTRVQQDGMVGIVHEQIDVLESRLLALSNAITRIESL